MEAIYASGVGNWVATSGPWLVSWILAVGAIASYALLRPGKGMRFAAICLLAFGILARAAIAAYQTAAQYWLWGSEAFTQLFLPPNQPIGYFLSYAGSRFWLPLGLAILCALVWYGFLRLLGRRTARFFDIGEMELAALAVFVVGWPLCIVLLPVAGVLLIVFSIVRLTVFKEQFTTLGIPFLAAMTLVLLWGSVLLRLTGWEVY